MTERANALEPWWKSTTVYQIYPRSFADANGDGIGDLHGILKRLDYLNDLGVETIWLSPIYPSPMADFGYDVADFTDIDPVFGDLAVFDSLVAALHERQMKILLDWVPNHTSCEHRWFQDALQGPDAQYRDFYIWRDPAPDGGPPNNWRDAFLDRPAWTFDDASGQYYLHLFLPGQPDLNWSNPLVEQAMHDTLRFWLDRGVDGFRADVIYAIGKDAALADDPDEFVGLPHCAVHDEPSTHPLLRSIRTLLDSYPQQPMMVGEVVLLDVNLMVKYFGNNDELHLNFNFAPTHLPWDATMWRQAIEDAQRAHATVDAWPSWVLSNHDLPRHRTRYSRWPNAEVDEQGSLERAKAAAVLLLTLRGTPFLYQGEELGLDDAIIPDDRVVDPGGRDGCRAPIPWDDSEDAGWENPWLPLPPNQAVVNASAQRRDPGSMFTLYRSILALRKQFDALQAGQLELLTLPQGIVGFRRFGSDADSFVTLVSMSDEPTHVSGISGTVVIDSLDVTGVPSPFTGRLRPRQAVVVRSTAVQE